MDTVIVKKQNKKIRKDDGLGNGKAKVSMKTINGNGLMEVVDGEVTKIRKRSGEVVVFDIAKIVNAAYRAILATGEGDENDAMKIARKVYLELLKNASREDKYIPNVEEVQDLVEKHLILSDFVQAAKAYILYRKERAELRETKRIVSDEVKRLAEDSSKHFTSSLGEFVYYRTYSRWRDDLERREFWSETVDRYVDFIRENLGKKISPRKLDELKKAIL